MSSQAVIKHNGKDYNSMGLIVVNNYKGLGNCVVLYEEKHGRFCDILSGRTEVHHGNINRCIVSEVHEESRASLQVTESFVQKLENNNHYVEFPGATHNGNKGLIRVYVANLAHVSSTYYDINKKYMKHYNCNEPAYNETNSVHRVKLSDINNYLIHIGFTNHPNKKDFQFPVSNTFQDIKGKPIGIRLQALRAIAFALYSSTAIPPQPIRHSYKQEGNSSYFKNRGINGGCTDVYC